MQKVVSIYKHYVYKFLQSKKKLKYILKYIIK